MINLKQWMETVDYRITEGSNYGWSCYGPNAYSLDSWDGDYDGCSFGIIFDTKTQTVYQVEAHDYEKKRSYRLVNPDYYQALRDEANSRGVEHLAWDNVPYTDLDVDQDWLTKARAIFLGEDYDDRVSITVEFSDEELLEFMKMAHDRDITFNQLIEQALTEAIKNHEKDPESFRSRHQLPQVDNHDVA